MSKLRITGDSTIDLSADLLDKYQIGLMPLYLTMGEKSYRHGTDISHADIYAYVEKTGTLPKTAAPSVADYLATVSYTHLDVYKRQDVCLVYMTNRISPKLVREVRHRITQIKLDVILTSGYIQPFLEGKPWSLFSDVGTTERPDTLAAKINEGRIAILVDGTPFALIVPYLFSENFQSLDDYARCV